MKTAMPTTAIGKSIDRIERREWFMWSAAVVVTLLLTAGLASFLLREDDSLSDFPQAVRGLIGLVLIFDIYTLFQQLQIHRMRRRLIRGEELFRLISENAADLIAVVDMEGKRIFNSFSYERVLGYSLEELRQSSSSEQIHPEDREKVRQAAEEARHTGVGKPLEYRVRHKDGSWRVLESTASVIRNSKGEPESFVIVNRDVTERKRSAEALRRSEAGFRSVVEDAPYGIYRATLSGELVLVNSALEKMLGYSSQEDLLGTNLAESIYRYPLEHQKLNETLLQQDSFKDIELEWKRKDGAPIIVRCSGCLIKDETGAAAYVEVFAEDITERRTLERQLRMAQKMEAVGRLTGGIAHDFNNLLGVIIGYSQVLKRGLGTEHTSFEHADEIEKAGKRAVSLTRQLLAFSRQQVLEPVVLNLNTLVSDMEKMLPRLIGEDVALKLELDASLLQVKADPSQIEQVILNLTVNARDAMPDGGRLLIHTANVNLDTVYTHNHPGSRAGSYVMLRVTDTGTGIDPEIQSQIFEPFFTTKERDKGTGLGLATVYGIVKQSGGYIAVDSEKGKGASFSVYLPPLEQAATHSVAPLAATPVNTRGTETILLVEDAEPLRKLAEMFLKESGYRILSAGDGQQALQMARQHLGPINLLLTDVVMPGMNGRVLGERLAPSQPGMKVLYMSGYTDSFIAGHGVLEAGTHLLHKPFTQETLTRKVREILDAKLDDVGREKADSGFDPVFAEADHRSRS